jgi:methylmalonyl-CoA/ethylmalonyl-CoA epimerase
MKIDHYGIVVPNIEHYLQMNLPVWLKGQSVGPLIEDPLQKVRVAFIEVPGGRIELIEPATEDSPVREILKKRGSSHHHVCFEVENLDSQLLACSKVRMLVVSPPKPAVAFAGRRIAFVMGRDLLLWELLEQ